MNELITLSCPSCGGKLTIQKDASTYVCDYCGQTHRLRIEDVEAFSRCPVCHRNDKVEKLTSIRKRQDNLAQTFSLPEIPPYVIVNLPDSNHPDTKRPVAIETTFKFISPRTKKAELSSYLGIVIFILIAINKSSSFWFLFLLISMAALGVYVTVNSIRGKTEEKMAQKAISEQIPPETAKMNDRYNSIYYCHRDDVVFIPGEEEAVPSSDFVQFLFKPLDRRIMQVGLYPEKISKPEKRTR